MTTAAATATRCSRPARLGFTIDSHTIDPPVRKNTTGARRTTARYVNSPTTAADGPVSRTCPISGRSPMPPQPGPIRSITRTVRVPASVVT